MDTLYTALPAFGARSCSPFAMKALSLFTLAARPFERIDVSPDKGPRGKVPFLKRADGTVVADSANLYRLLVTEGLDLPEGSVPVRRLIEEHLYFAQMHARWTWHGDAVRDTLFAEVPWPIRGFVYGMVGRQVRAALRGQGLGRRPLDEVTRLVEEDLDALEAELKGRAFLGGSEPCLADLSLHGLLEQVLHGPDDPFTTAVRAHTPLVALHGRVERLVYDTSSTEEAV